MKYDLQQTTKLVTQLQQAHLAVDFVDGAVCQAGGTRGRFLHAYPPAIRYDRLSDAVLRVLVLGAHRNLHPSPRYISPIRHFGMVLSAAVCFDSCLPGQDIQQGSKRR
jgi:hypothetical protein